MLDNVILHQKGKKQVAWGGVASHCPITGKKAPPPGRISKEEIFERKSIKGRREKERDEANYCFPNVQV